MGNQLDDVVYFDYRVKKHGNRLPKLNIGVPELIILSFFVAKNGQVCNIELIQSSFYELYQTSIFSIFKDTEFKKISKAIKRERVLIPI